MGDFSFLTTSSQLAGGVFTVTFDEMNFALGHGNASGWNVPVGPVEGSPYFAHSPSATLPILAVGCDSGVPATTDRYLHTLRSYAAESSATHAVPTFWAYALSPRPSVMSGLIEHPQPHRTRDGFQPRKCQIPDQVRDDQNDSLVFPESVRSVAPIAVKTSFFTTAKARCLTFLRDMALAFDKTLAAPTKHGDVKAFFLEKGKELTAETVIKAFKQCWPGEDYKVAGDLKNLETGFAVYNEKTLHAMMVRAGKFIPVNFKTKDDRYTDFIFGTVPGSKQLQTHRTEPHNRGHKRLLQRVARALTQGAYTLSGLLQDDTDHAKLGGAFYVGIELEGAAVDPRTGKSVDLSVSAAARPHLNELGSEMIETDTGMEACPRQILLGAVAAQQQMLDVAQKHWEEMRRNLGKEAAGPRPVITNVSVPMNDPTTLRLANDKVESKYGGYVAGFENRTRRNLAFRGDYSRVVADQIAAKEGFADASDMLSAIMKNSLGAWWNPRAAQVNVGLPNLWTASPGWYNKLLNYLGIPRGRFTVSAHVQKDAANILFGRWVIGFTQMVNASSPWLRGIVPDLGEGMQARDMRTIIGNDLDTAWGMNRALRDDADLVMTGIRNMVMGRVDRVERSRLPHELSETVEFPDGSGQKIPDAKVSVHGGGRSRDEVSGQMRDYGSGLVGWIKAKVFGPHFEGDFDQMRGRHEVTRPSNSDALAISNSGIWVQLLAMQAVKDSANDINPVRHFAEMAGMSDFATADLDSLVVGGDEIALRYLTRGASDPEVSKYFDQLEKLIKAIDIPLARNQCLIALGMIAAMREPSRGLADYALSMRGSLGDALLWEFNNGTITKADDAVRAVAAFQDMQRRFIRTRKDFELDSYLQRRAGAGFVFNVNAGLNFGLGNHSGDNQKNGEEPAIIPVTGDVAEA